MLIKDLEMSKMTPRPQEFTERISWALTPNSEIIINHN